MGCQESKYLAPCATLDNLNDVSDPAPTKGGAGRRYNGPPQEGAWATLSRPQLIAITDKLDKCIAQDMLLMKDWGW